MSHPNFKNKLINNKHKNINQRDKYDLQWPKPLLYWAYKCASTLASCGRCLLAAAAHWPGEHLCILSLIFCEFLSTFREKKITESMWYFVWCEVSTILSILCWLWRLTKVPRVRQHPIIPGRLRVVSILLPRRNLRSRKTPDPLAHIPALVIAPITFP